MNIKVNNVLAHLAKNGNVTIKMDRASGVTQLTVSRRQKGDYVVGSHPGSKLAMVNLADLKAELIANSIYIESWR